MIYAADLDYRYHVAKYAPDGRGGIRLVSVCDGRRLHEGSIIMESPSRVCFGCRRALDLAVLRNASPSREEIAQELGGASHESAINGVDDPRGLSPA